MYLLTTSRTYLLLPYVYAVIVCGQYVRNKYFGVPKFDLGRN